MKMTSKKLNTKLSGIFIVLLTAVYLFASSAIVRAATVTSEKTSLQFESDHLSWGDVLTFDAAKYNQSLYAQQNAEQEYSYYPENTASENSNTNPDPIKDTGWKYYGSVTIENKAGITAGEKLETYPATHFIDKLGAQTTVIAPVGIDGVTIPVVTAGGTGITGVYSVVPASTGAYRIYVYSESGNPSENVHYALLDSYDHNNQYGNQMGTIRTFIQIPNTNWYYTELNVGNLSWSAYSLSVEGARDKVSNADSKTTDKGTGSFKGNTDTVLNTSSYYHSYNKWTKTERWYNTVLVVQFKDPVMLGPITKTGDTLNVSNATDKDGTITAKNIFGEPVAFGSNYHMPVYFTAAPSGEAQFSGFTDGNGNSVEMKSYTMDGMTYYEHLFEESISLTAEWERQIDFATVKVSGSKVATMHYYTNKAVTHDFSYSTDTVYTFTADYANAVDADIQYSVTRDGVAGESGTLSKNGDLSVSLTAKWETMVITFTSNYDGEERSMTFTAKPSYDGLEPVAKINSTNYYFLEDALVASSSGNTVVLLKDYTFQTGNRKAAWGNMSDGTGLGYTVRSGVTLIVPYASSYDYDEISEHPYSCEGKTTSTSGTGGAKPGDGTTYMTLTVPSGINLKVASGGIMAVGGTTNGVEMIVGPHADVHLQSGAKITVDGTLSSCGFIYGGGNLYGNRDSKIYVPFTVHDFRGGGYTVAAAGKLSQNYGVKPITGENAVSPFLRYSFQAIQCKQVIYQGADVIAYADLRAGDGDNNSNAYIISDNPDNCLLALTDSNSYVEIKYDGNLYASTYPAVGKMYLTVYGNATYGGLELYVDISVTSATVNTRQINFVLPYNFDIRIASGTFAIPNSIMLLPGASVTVDEGATLDVSGALTVYDGLHDYTTNGKEGSTEVVLKDYAAEYPNAAALSPSSSYPSSTVLMGGPFYGGGAADLIINGTLNLKSGSSLGGVVQTTSTGSARINTDASMGTSTTTQIGVTGYYSINILIVNKQYAYAGATVRTLNGQILDTSTGERINIQPGRIYYPSAGADKIDSYAYDLYYYGTSESPSVKQTITENVNLILQGSWYNYAVPVYTVLDGQVSSEPIMNYFAHGTNLEGKEYYTDEACTNAATTVTSDDPLYYKGTCEASVVWADGSGETNYPTVRQAIKAAVNSGDRVVLQTDLTDFTELIAPGDGQDFIFDLNGHTMVCLGTAFTNKTKQGKITLDLNGGTVKNTGDSTDPIVTVLKDSSLVLDINGGTLEYCTAMTTDDTLNQAKAAIVNGGDLVIKDTAGTGVVKGGLNLDIKSVTPVNYVSLIRNEYDGQLSISNVKLETTQNANSFNTNVSTVIFNGNGAHMNLENATLNSIDGYSIYNLGGVIDSIRGGSISGEYGIYNQNVRSGSQTVGNGYQVDYVGKILDVFDVTINVTQYGIYNRGSIGTIGGNTNITANTNAVYNDYNWYYDTIWNRYVHTTNSDSANRVYYSDLTSDFSGITADKLIAGLKGETGGVQIAMPSIARITGSTKLNATSTGTGYALYNRGYIGQITGNTTISATKNYAMRVIEGGYVGVIDGYTTISAGGNYGLYIDGQRNAEYVDYRDAAYKVQNKVDYTSYIPTRVHSIGGNVTINAAGSYALQVNAELGSISGNATITAKSYAVNVGGAGAIQSRVYTRIYADSVETNRKNVYQYDPAIIGSIGADTSNSVSITTTSTYGINNAGVIKTIGPGTTIRSSQYAVNNTTGRYNALTEEISSAADTYDSAQYLTQYLRTYNYLQPTIETINGASITSTSTHALLNYGNIGTICNASVSSGTNDNALVNHPNGSVSGQETKVQYYRGASLFSTTTSQFSAQDTSGTVGFVKATIGSIENCTITGKNSVLNNGGEIGSITGSDITATGNYAVYNAARYRTAVTYALEGPAYNSETGKWAATAKATATVYDACSIGTIGTGNKLQAAASTLYNSGKITLIGDESAEDKLQIIATGGIAVYNYRGLATVDGYESAYIGKIQNAEIVGTSVAIQNGDGNGSYTDVTIGELGEGLVAVATDDSGYAVKDHATNASIGLISGGHYYSGAKSRDNAIYQPDAQKYPEGKTLTTETEEAFVGEKSYQCYYIGDRKHVHTYGDPVDTWTVESETGLAKLIASITCANCAENTEGKVLSETVENISGTPDPGNCETKASTTYTATVTLNGQSHSFTYVAESEAYGDHNWSDWTQVTAPTCTEKGQDQRSCSICKTVETRDVEATGSHTEILDTENSVPAGCETAGKNVYKCKLCGIWLRDEALPAAGHGEEVLDTVNSVAVDCEKDGLNVYNCKVCGVKLREETIPARTHDWMKDENAYTAPSCTAEGSQGYICRNNANHTKTEPIDMIPHTYVKENFAWAWTADFNACTVSTNCTECGLLLEMECVVNSVETISPTETVQGEMTHTATVTIGETSYSDVKTTMIPVLGHNYVGQITQAATCEEPGVMTYTCQNEECTERTYTEPIPATGHSWKTAESEDNKAPTCEEPGSQYYVCGNDANHTKTEILEALGHSYTAAVTKEATCSEPGVMTYTCQNDETHTYTEEIPTLAHSWSEWTEVTAPTCTEAGLEQRACSVCGAEETQEVEATGHGEAVLDAQKSVAADCENDGLNVFVCPTCGETTREVTIPATNHDWKEVESAYVAPSCEVPGSRSYVCDNDPTHKKTEEIPATGHSWTEEESAYVAPSCEELGSRSYFCENDPTHEKTEEIPATGHSWNEGQVTQEPTCDAVGTKLFTCQNDETHTYTEEIPALGHSYTNVVTNPSCTTEGYTTHTCQVCGDSYVDDYVEPSGHNYQVTGTIAATCTQPGSETSTCAKCGDVKTETIEASGHSPAQPEFTWEEDLSSCSATSSCVTCQESLPVNCVVRVEQQADKTVYTAVATVCNVPFTDTKEIPDIYEIKISWNQTGSAVYSEGIANYTWNPSTMTYSSETTGTGWSGKSEVKFTIDNTGSNTGIVVGFRYTPILDGTFSWENLTDNWDLTIEKGSSGQAGFAVTPDADAKPQKPEDGETTIVLGTITITLEKETKQDGNVQ